MVAGRSARALYRWDYDDIINRIDWNRVLIEAAGLHAKNDPTDLNAVCGACIRFILLNTED